MKRIIGFLALVLGVVGVVGCVGGMVGTWVVAEKLYVTSSKVLDGGKNALGAIKQNFEQADKAVGKVSLEARLAGVLADRYSKRPATRRKTQAELTDKQKALDAQFANAQEQAAKLSITAQTIAAALDKMEGLPTPIGREITKVKTWVPATRSLADTSSTLRNASNKLDRLKKLIGELREGGEQAKQAAGSLATIAKEVSDDLESVQTKMRNFETKLGELDEEIETLQGEVPRWIFLGKMGVLVVLVWLALGQLCLVRCGWWLMRNLEGQTQSQDTTKE